jgi:mannosyltransferase
VRSTPRLLANLVAAAAALRLIGLADLSLWLDEGVTWKNASQPTLAETVSSEANHPPAWWLATRAALALGARGEAGLRLPAAVLGLASVLLAWWLAVRLLDPARVPRRGRIAGLDAGAAAWVAVLAAANPFWVELSQEARMYAALLAESMGLSILYLRWLDRGGRGTLAAYAALAVVSLHTHYFAAWTVAGHAVHAVWAARATRADGAPVRATPFLVAAAAAGLAFLPWFLHARGGMRSFDAPWTEGPGRALHALWRMGAGPGLVVLDRERSAGGLAAILREESGTIAATGLLWFVPVVLGVLALRRDRGLRALVLACVGVPLAALLAAYARWPLLEARYLVGLSPFLVVLAVLGARSAPRVLRPVLLGGLLLLSAASLASYHAPDTAVGRFLSRGHPYGKEQWREANAWAAQHLAKDDLVVLHAPYVEAVWAYYDRGAHPVVRLPFEAVDAGEILRRHPEVATARRAVLVLSHEETEDPDHYLTAFREAWLRASLEGGGGATFGDAVTFPRQWGIRAYSFSR